MLVQRTAEQLGRDAWEIWQAGLAAVRSERLMRDAVQLDGSALLIGDDEIDLAAIERIWVVGAGKAGAGMAATLEEILGPRLLAAKQVTGWVNVPADCVRKLAAIHLHAARPAGRNEPTAAGIAGAERILEIAGGAGPRDLCICLISGGASALLPAPTAGVSLADKLAVTRALSAAGANIAELNTVRKQLSRIKGGGLLRACRVGRLATLVISDVIGDPLEVIGSGPTVPDESTAAEALAVLERYDARRAGVPQEVFDYLRGRTATLPAAPTCQWSNLVIGNNATAVDAAGVKAEQLGYSHAMHCATTHEGEAEAVGRHLARMAMRMRGGPGPDCLITGGEPVVTLAPEGVRGQGGRNQQLALAALIELESAGAEGIALLSGATDGEDGPTDAAGAMIDPRTMARARGAASELADALRRSDAYPTLERLGMLLKTGPTNTNVCDVRVVVVDRVAERAP